MISDMSQQIGGYGNGQQVGSDAARNAAEALRQGAQAVQQSVRATGEALARARTATAEVTQQSSAARTEVMRRVGVAATETLQHGAQVLAGTQRAIVRNTAEQLVQASRQVAEAAQANAADLRDLLTLPSASRGGVGDIQQSMTGFVDSVARTNLQMVQGLMQFDDLHAFVALQQRFVRGYMDTWMQGTATVARATRYTADETLRHLDRQIQQRQQDVSDQRRNPAE